MQTYSDFEIIVADNASTDDTARVVDEFQNRCQVRYIRHPNDIDIAANWRSAFEAASGDYFALLNDDDMWEPDFLKQTVAALDAHPSTALTSTGCYVMDEQGEIDLARTEVFDRNYGRDRRAGGLFHGALHIITEYPFVLSATLFRSDVMRSLGSFRELAGPVADFDLLVRLALGGYDTYFIPDRLMRYRLHTSQTSRKLMTHLYIARVWESFRGEGQLEKVRRRKLSMAACITGVAYLEQGQRQEAGRHLLKAILAYPAHVWPWLSLSLWLLPWSLPALAVRVIRFAWYRRSIQRWRRPWAVATRIIRGAS